MGPWTIRSAARTVPARAAIEAVPRGITGLGFGGRSAVRRTGSAASTGSNYPGRGPAASQRGASTVIGTVSRTGVPSARTAGRKRTSASIARIFLL